MKKKNLLIIVLFLSVITIFLGISVAIFRYVGKGTTNNVIETGRIIFSYSDAEPNNTSNPISIENALPMQDTIGKILSSPNEYFDFSVTASTTSTDLAYEITVMKQKNSTLDEDVIKMYLTELNGDKEVETPITGGDITPTYKELKDTSNKSMVGKSIYFGTVKAGEIAYGKNFRFRMWIKYDDTNVSNSANDENPTNEGKEFIVKINVSAIGNN